MEEKNRVTATGIALELENLQRLILRKQTVKSELCPDLVAEVLARLPCKSLLRFKCLSKMWRSTISDPSFCAARRRTVSTSGLFITRLDNYDYFSSSSLGCFYATRGDGDSSSWLLHKFPIPYCKHYTGAIEVVKGLDLFPMNDVIFSPLDTEFHRFPMLYGNYYTEATEVVNGLVCFYKGNLASVFNLSTREIMCLPCFSDAEPKPKPKTLNYNYYFGYVSSCNKYKLLKLYNLTGGREWEFLTLGKDALWRRPSSRADAPPIDLKRYRSSVYIDGAVCCWHKKISNSVILLDYADESWQLVDLPPQIAKPCCCFLLLLRGRFAVASPIDRCFQLEIWVLEGGSGGGGGPSPFWTNHFIIDTVIGFPNFDCFIGNLPTGEVLLTFCGMCFPIYAFDPTNGSFEDFEIGKFPSARQIANMIHAFYYKEDMIPLRHRISNKLQIMSTRDTPHVKFIKLTACDPISTTNKLKINKTPICSN